MGALLDLIPINTSRTRAYAVEWLRCGASSRGGFPPQESGDVRRRDGRVGSGDVRMGEDIAQTNPDSGTDAPQWQPATSS
jgi:hypothetical protein